jgi:hypothetical protein
VPGIGEKTAAGLLTRFGDLAGVRTAAADPGSDLSSAQRRRLLEAAEYLDAAPGVVRVAREAPVPEVDDLLPAGPPDHARVIGLAERWGLSSSLARMVAAMTAAATTANGGARD